MPDNYDRLKINEPNIVHENIDGETIILNLDTGNYYTISNFCIQVSYNKGK